MLHNDISLLQIMLFCCKICFVAIYAVLSRNLFCCYLRAFVWRKIEPKIVLVEKKRQISGMEGHDGDDDEDLLTGCQGIQGIRDQHR